MWDRREADDVGQSSPVLIEKYRPRPLRTAAREPGRAKRRGHANFSPFLGTGLARGERLAFRAREHRAGRNGRRSRLCACRAVQERRSGGRRIRALAVALLPSRALSAYFKGVTGSAGPLV